MSIIDLLHKSKGGQNLTLSLLVSKTSPENESASKVCKKWVQGASRLEERSHGRCVSIYSVKAKKLFSSICLLCCFFCSLSLSCTGIAWGMVLILTLKAGRSAEPGITLSFRHAHCPSLLASAPLLCPALFSDSGPRLHCTERWGDLFLLHCVWET